MAKTVQYVVPVELREADDGPMLRGLSCKKDALHTGGERKYFRRSPLCGRLTGSLFVASIAGQSLPASFRSVTLMAAFVLRHAPPKRSSPPTKRAAISLSSFTHWQRSARRAGCERFNARC